MAHIIVSALILFTVSFCDARSPTCGGEIKKKVGDVVEFPSRLSSSSEITDSYWKYGEKEIVINSDVMKDSPFKDKVSISNTYNLILSGLTLQDSGTFIFSSSVDGKQRDTVTFNLIVYEAITNVDVRKTNSTWSPATNTCAVWLECFTSSPPSGEGIKYTWTIGNKTFMGAKLEYILEEGEETVNCTVSNPASEKSDQQLMTCMSGGTSPSPTFLQFGYMWTGLGEGLLVLVLVLVLVCRWKRRKAAPVALDSVYTTIENFTMKDTHQNKSNNELMLGSLNKMIDNTDMRPQSQKILLSSIYCTIQPSAPSSQVLREPSS